MNVGSVNSVGIPDFSLLPAQFPARHTSPAGSVPAARENAPAALPDNGGVRYFSEYGDRAEISSEAMDLWRSLADGNAVSPMQSGFQKPPGVMDTAVLQPARMQPETAAPKIEFTRGILPDGGVDASVLKPVVPEGECKTCESRRYIDKSDDASVSYQTPTKLNASTAVSAVASHENEHVRNERGNAFRENREIVSQTVTLTYDCCPECGKLYVSGGTTRTMSVGKSESKSENEDAIPFNANEKT